MGGVEYLEKAGAEMILGLNVLCFHEIIHDMGIYLSNNNIVMLTLLECVFKNLESDFSSKELKR